MLPFKAFYVSSGQPIKRKTHFDRATTMPWFARDLSQIKGKPL
jgi:hypothetical protein